MSTSRRLRHARSDGAGTRFLPGTEAIAKTQGTQSEGRSSMTTEAEERLLKDCSALGLWCRVHKRDVGQCMAIAAERARITREIAEKIEGDITAILAIVDPCEHDWQRSGPVSDGHLFCPNCGCHKDECSERPPSCEQHPEDF